MQHKSSKPSSRHSGLHHYVHLAVNPIAVIVIIIIIIIIFISLLILFITPFLHLMSFRWASDLMKRPSFCRRTWKLTKCVLDRPPKIQPKAEDSTTTNKQTMDHGLSLLPKNRTNHDDRLLINCTLDFSNVMVSSYQFMEMHSEKPGSDIKWHKKDWLLHLWVKVYVHKQSCRWHPQGQLIPSVILVCKFPSEFAQFGSSGLLSINHKLSLCTLDASVWFFLEENAFIFIYPPNLGCKSRLYLRPTHPRNLDQNWGGPDIPNWKLALTAENAKLILTIYDGLMLLKLQKQTATTTTTTTTTKSK